MARRNKLNSPEKRARIGERIKVAAAQAGLTLKELAEKTGISPSFIYQYVRGITGIPAHVLEQVAEITKVPLDFFDPDRDSCSALVLSHETHAPGTAVMPAEDHGPDARSRIQSELRHLEALSVSYRRIGRNRTASVSTVEQRLALTRALGDRGQEALLIEELGEAKQQSRQGEEAAHHFMAAAKLFAAHGMEQERARVLSSLSDLLTDEGRFDAAHKLLTEALDSPGGANSAFLLLSLGRLHHRERRFVEALRCICRAASATEARPQSGTYADPNSERRRETITEIAFSTGRFDAVLALWTTGLKQAVTSHDAESYLDALIYLGRGLHAVGQLGQACYRLESAIASGLLLDDIERASIAHSLLTRVQLSIGALESARESARAARRLASRSQGARPIILAALANAECSVALGRWQDALKAGQDAAQEAAKAGYKEEASQALEMRARAYLGMFQGAHGPTDVEGARSAQFALAEATLAVSAADAAQSLQEQVAARITLARCLGLTEDVEGIEREAQLALDLLENEDIGRLTELLEQEADMVPVALCTPDLNLPHLFYRRKTSLPELSWQAYSLIADSRLRRSGQEAAYSSFKSAVEQLIILLGDLTPSQILAFQNHFPAARTAFEELIRCAITPEAVEETSRILASTPWFYSDAVVALVGTHSTQPASLAASFDRVSGGRRRPLSHGAPSCPFLEEPLL